ncbi:ArsR family transcriptional regulator [Halobellus sp. Atlit-38R]|uniref:ArsR/SmtB family transcription factor n=1 Tax=Halobellus sp. Atlit-38R TaxID=2282131 RepID=UPI000EF1C607|nr:winged helix-turn-helix domain-containing protein [Halobellus sp. Atlit-38R]RLM88177.1 ArsR family transcriptional regulator [Halobellus sp. Atlit-38R]
MARLLPSQSEPDVDASPRVVGLDDDDADDLLSALSSGTARQILSTLHEEPTNPAALADAVDTSLQNVQYHIQRLEDAGAVEVVDTAYSEKGREMNVYAPANRPLVVVAADGEETAGLSAALKRLLGGVAVVGVASILAQVAIEGLPFGAQTGGADGGVSVQTTESTRIATETAASSGFPPGLLVFLGGLTVLLTWFAVWFVRQR